LKRFGIGIAFGIAVALAIAALAAARIDISAHRDILGDAAIRDSVPHPPAADRFADPSPFTIWIPSDWFIWDSLRSGRLPIWERLQGGGYPPLVTMYNGVFHPVRWLVTLVPRNAVPSALIVIGFLIAFLGTYLFCRAELALSRLSSLIGAAAFTLSGAFVSYADFSGSILPLAHLPWLLLVLRRAERSRSAVDVSILAGLVALVIASGHPSLAFVTLMTTALFALADAIEARSPAPLILISISGALGVLLASIVIFPVIAARGEIWTYKTSTPQGSPYEPLVLARWLHAISGVLIDQVPSRIDMLPFFSFAGIAASALASVVAAMAFVRPRLFTILAPLAVLYALAIPGPWLLELADFAPLKYLKGWYVAGAAAFFLAAAIAIGFDAVWRRSRAIAIVLAAAMLIQYAWRDWTVLAPHRFEPIPNSSALAFLRAHPGERITGLWGQTHVANSSRITGIEDARLVAPVMLDRYQRWWSLVDPRVRSHAYPTTRMTDRLGSPLVADFNIRYVLENRYPSVGFETHWNEPRDSKLSPLLASAPVVLRTPSLLIHELPAPAGPRAHFAERVAATQNVDQAMRTLKRDPTLHVIERKEGAVGIPPIARGSVAVSYPSDSTVLLKTDSDTGGVVVLHDTFASCWKATFDGKPTDVFPVNILSRGVVVPRGAHTVRMWYEPPGLRWGAIASAVTTLLMIIGMMVSRRV
jgi:hypothetical protein